MKSRYEIQKVQAPGTKYYNVRDLEQKNDQGGSLVVAKFNTKKEAESFAKVENKRLSLAAESFDCSK